MISVIIPVFKNSATLKRTLRSFQVLDGALQREIEVVIVFDGADTSCEEIVKEWQSETSIGNQVLIKTHSGVSSARNDGIKLSKGTIITFLDADDEILSDRIRTALFGVYDDILIGKQELVISDETYMSRLELLSVLAPSEFHIMSMLLSRDIFEEIGLFDEDFTVGSDWDFIVRARKAGVVIEYSDSYFVRRHIHLSNASLDVEEVRKQQLLSLMKNIRNRKKFH